MQFERPDTVWEPVPVSSSEQGELDLKWIVGVVRRRLWLIALCAILATALAVLVVMQFRPDYASEARIFFEGERLNVVEMEDVLVNPNIGLEDQVQLVLSQNLLEAVVRELGLLESAEFNPEVAEFAATTDGEADAGDLAAWLAWAEEAAQDLLVVAGLAGEPIDEAVSDPEAAQSLLLAAAVRSLRESLSVRAISSRVLSIGIVTPDPQLSADIVNAVAERFILDQLSARLEATRSATDWLTARSAELEDRVQEAEASVEEARAELSREAGQSTKITQAQVASLNVALSDQQVLIPGLEARYERAREVLEGGGDYGSFSDFRESPRLGALRERRAELEAQQRSLADSVGENHPARRAVRTQIADVDAAMREEAQRITDALGNDLKAARTAADELAGRMRALESKALGQTRAELRVRQLEREAQASRILYETFLGRLQETAEQQKLQSSDARIISPAEPAIEPESHKKRLIVAGGGIGGLGLGLGLAFLLEIFSTRFRHPEELESATGLPVLGALPTIGRMGRRESILPRLGTRRGRLLTEAVRDMRTSILLSNLDRPPQVVMFTSAVPGDGKSASSLLTALASQEMGMRTVLVECDLRRPGLGRLFRKPADAPGILSVLTGQVPVEAAVFTDEKSGLGLLTMQPRDKMVQRLNPADILASQRFATLLDELRATYDFVVLDAPPLLAVTDARVIAPLADAMVFVVMWGRTPRAAVAAGIKLLERGKAPLIGLCMTAINEKQARRFSNQQYGFYPGEYRKRYM